MEHFSIEEQRAQKLLSGIQKTARCIEVGPSFRPLAPKSEGWNTCIVDHAGRVELAEKYKNAGVPLEAIEEVDIIWREGALHEAFPDGSKGTYDALLASHVLEHIPDLLGFLKSAAELLCEEGRLCFALPDKRRCFDFFRPATLAGEVLLAHHEKRRKPGAAVLFNEVAYSVALRGNIAWSSQQTLAEGLTFFHPFNRAKEIFEAACSEEQIYRDAHCWQFTPKSFELLILDLASAHACEWKIAWIKETENAEFIGHLSRGTANFQTPGELQAMRMELLIGILNEMKESIEACANRTTVGHAEKNP